MSDADDIDAIAAFLKKGSTQTSAEVDACTTLDEETKSAWYDLAKRILAFVSSDHAHDAPASTLLAAKSLRAEFGAMLASLASKGCAVPALGDIPADAPAPPPKGTPNPLLDSPFAHMLENPTTLIVVALVVWAFLKGRSSR